MAIELHRPRYDAPGEWMNCATSIIYSTAEQLGDRYDAAMRERIGKDWLYALGRRRGEAYELHDPGFVFTEPARFGDSPLRELLPREGAFFNLMDDAYRLRNRWIHRHVEPTRENVLALIDVYQPFAAQAGLSLPPQLRDLRAVVRDAPADPPRSRTDEARRYREEAERARADEERARAEADQAHAEAERYRREVDEAIDVAAAVERRANEGSQVKARQQLELEAQRRRIAELEAAKEEADRRLVEAEREAERAAAAAAVSNPVDPDDSPLADLQAGDPWPDGLDTVELLLSRHLRDLFDPRTNDYLGRHDPAAKAAAEEWLGVLPQGGTVLLADGVFCGAYVGGVLAHLGRLDGQAAANEAVVGGPVSGFFRPDRYLLHVPPEAADLVDVDTGWSLVREHGEAGAACAAELAAQFPDGGDVSVTLRGAVAAYVDDEWVCIGTLP